MLRDDRQPTRRRRWSPVAPATPIAALAVAVIAGDPDPSATHQVFLVVAVVIAVLAVICDVLTWRLERDTTAPTTTG